jgi:hypothetical protein
MSMSAIKNQKDLGAGLLYIAFGAVGFFVARDYGMGQASRMGPGYFPTVLSALLVLLGAAAVVRSFISKHPEEVGKFAWKAIAFVCGSTALFGFLLPTAGFVVALLVLCFVSAAASQFFKFEWKAVGALVVLVVFCVLVFAKGLGVPLPVVGTWFGG